MEDKFSILVAEDEKAAQFLYEEELSEEGWEVTLADNGLQVLGLLEDRAFDLLLTDVKMPDMHALEMIPRVREEHPDLPVVVVSAYQGLEDDFQLQSHRIRAFVRKPVDFEALKRLIREIAGEKAS